MSYTLNSTKYQNNLRTVTGTPTIYPNDIELLCDTTSAPVIINLLEIPDNYWDTQWKMYIIDSGNAATNNITINAGTGQTINGQSSLTVNVNSVRVVILVSSNSSFIAFTSNITAKTSIVIFNNMVLDSLDLAADYQPFANKSYTVPANTLQSNGDILNIFTIVDKQTTSSVPSPAANVFINGNQAITSTVNIGQSIEFAIIQIELSKKSNTEAYVVATITTFIASGNAVSQDVLNKQTMTGFDFLNTSFNISTQAKLQEWQSGTVYCPQLRIEKFMV